MFRATLFQTRGFDPYRRGFNFFRTQEKYRVQNYKFHVSNTSAMADNTPPIPPQNAPYVASDGPYQTTLPAADEARFQDWVQTNNVPFDPKDKAPDYDMRGFWQGVQNADPKAMQGYNLNDNTMHFPDYWKTPYHESFSNESQWATKDAPKWNTLDQLIDRNGNVVFDERAKAKKRKETEPQS